MIEENEESQHEGKNNYEQVPDKTPRVEGENNDYIKLDKTDIKSPLDYQRKSQHMKEDDKIKEDKPERPKPTDVDREEDKEDKLYETTQQKKEEKFNQPPLILHERPTYLEIKPVILQTPRLQLFGNINTLAVCPFCKYTGTMEISYKKSRQQKKLCCILSLTIIGILCFWIPFLIRALSDQVYSCSNCKRVLKIEEKAA